MRMSTRGTSTVVLLAAAGVSGALALSGLSPVTAFAAGTGSPDFGPNVKIFDPSTPVDQINSYLRGIANEEEFSAARHAVLFQPGTYGSAAGADDPATAAG